MSYGFLGRAPAADSGYFHHKSEHDMIAAYVGQTHVSGRYRQSRMSFEGPSFISYWTTIARWIGSGKKSACVVDVNSFDSSYTQGHRRDLERQLEAAKAVVFRIDIGNRRQTISEFRDPKKLRDHYISEFRTVPEPERTCVKTPDGVLWVPKRKHHKTKALGYLHRVSNLPKALEVCKFFGLACQRTQRLLDDQQEKVVDACGLLVSHYSRPNAAWYAKNYQLNPMRQQYEEADHRLAEMLQDAVKRAENGAGWFGTGDWMLRSHPALLASVTAIRARRKALSLRRKLRDERAEKKRLVSSDAKLKEIEARNARYAGPKHKDRQISLE